MHNCDLRGSSWGPALVIGQVLLFIRHMRRRPQLVAGAATELSEREVMWLEVATTLLLLPSLTVNLAYAYS